MGKDQEKQKYSIYWESLGKGDNNHHIPVENKIHWNLLTNEISQTPGDKHINP